jgi:hypothetical protein
MPMLIAPTVFKIALALLLKGILGEETARDIAADKFVELGGEKIATQLISLLNTDLGVMQLAEAGRRADEYFRSQCEDPDLRGTFSLSFGDLPSLQAAIRDLPNNLDESRLIIALHDILVRDFPNLKPEQVKNGTELFIDCLRRALLPLQHYTFSIIGHVVLDILKEVKELSREQRALHAHIEKALQGTQSVLPSALATPFLVPL